MTFFWLVFSISLQKTLVSILVSTGDENFVTPQKFKNIFFYFLLLIAMAMSNRLEHRSSDVHDTADIRSHYVRSVRRHDTRTFVDSLALANNEMLERLKQIGKLDSDVVNVIEMSPDLKYGLNHVI